MASQPIIQAPPEKLRQLRHLRAQRDAALREQARQARRYATPGELARAINPATVQTPALDAIDAAIVDTYSTSGGRLIVSMPPQEGKSERVTKTGSLWALARNPDLRIGIVSYASSLAEGFGRDIRNWIITVRSSSVNMEGIRFIFSRPTPCSPVMDPPYFRQHAIISLAAFLLFSFCTGSRASNRISG